MYGDEMVGMFRPQGDQWGAAQVYPWQALKPRDLAFRLSEIMSVGRPVLEEIARDWPEQKAEHLQQQHLMLVAEQVDRKLSPNLKRQLIQHHKLKIVGDHYEFVFRERQHGLTIADYGESDIHLYCGLPDRCDHRIGNDVDLLDYLAKVPIPEES